MIIKLDFLSVALASNRFTVMVSFNENFSSDFCSFTSGYTKSSTLRNVSKKKVWNHCQLILDILKCLPNALILPKCPKNDDCLI